MDSIPYIFAAIGAFFLIFICSALFVNLSNKRQLRIRLLAAFGNAPDKSDTEFESIESYYLKKREHSETDGNFIDEITWNDLSMNDIFDRINVCCSSVGEEYLYNCLHEPEFSPEKLEEREKLISFLESNPSLLTEIQIRLSRLGKQNYNGVYSFLYNPKLKFFGKQPLYIVLALLPFFAASTFFINPTVGVMSLVVSFFVNLVVYYNAKRQIERQLNSVNYIAGIFQCASKISRLCGHANLPVFDELKKSTAPFRSVAKKASGLFSNIANEMDFIAVYLKIMFLLDILNYNRIITLLSGKTAEFRRVYEIVGEIDMAACIVSYRKSLPFYSQPEFTDIKSVEFSEIYHPLLSEPVTNTDKITKNCVITGSNASGKSTFIKALAVNGILAQTIYTCNAKKFMMKPALVMTSMAVHDNIVRGESYFIAEIKSLKRMIEKTENVYCMCFVDEILRGTNTVERISASVSVLEFLLERNCLCIVASHDIELTSMLGDKYDFLYFCEQVTDNELFFDYKLKHGISNTRNAIKLLNYLNYDKRIVDRANKLSESFQNT